MSSNLTLGLDQGPLICAEGFQSTLERRGYLRAGEVFPEVAIEHPEALSILHRDFQRGGSDIVKAFTYNGPREKLRSMGKENRREPLNRAALQIARRVADDRPGNLMAGTISNTSIWRPFDASRETEVRAIFTESVGWAVEEGADMIIGENFHSAGEALIALEIARASGLPIVITIAPMATHAMDYDMKDGIGIIETCQRLEAGGADVVGLSCFCGPYTMLPWLTRVRAALSCHVAALAISDRVTMMQPTSFDLPENGGPFSSSRNGRTAQTALDPMASTPHDIGEFTRAAYSIGVKFLGVCWSASPMLLREVTHALGHETTSLHARL